MGLIERLEFQLKNVTGIGVSTDGFQFLLDDNKPRSSIREFLYINSGRAFHAPLNSAKIEMEALTGLYGTFLRPGERMRLEHTTLPNTLQSGPHFHPGGELVVVKKGSYFDADMHGAAIHTYQEGDIVLYTAGSTHRPLSKDGAAIFSIAFAGVVFADDAHTLLEKMNRFSPSEHVPHPAPVPREAFVYARMWMTPHTTK